MTSALPARTHMSIGEVLAQLRHDFPDVTISKIRFLETEGLVEPQRTPSGYRKFTHEDVERLRYVLSAQRDRYLPLRVIKEHLNAIDRGLEPPADAGRPRAPRSLMAGDGYPEPGAFTRDGNDIRLSRSELLESTGLDEKQLRQAEDFGLISARPQGLYDGDALLIGRTIAEMSQYGLEARHLRSFRAAADREVGLVEQVVTPMLRQRNPDARDRAGETVRELAALSVRLHAALVKAALRSELGR